MSFQVLFVLSTLMLCATGKKDFYTQLDGQFLDISAKGNQLWAVFCNNTIVRANLGVDGSFQSWTAVSTAGIPAGQKIVGVGASPDGSSFAVTDTNDNNIYGYGADTTTWRQAMGTLEQVSSCGSYGMLGVNRNHDGHWSLFWGGAGLFAPGGLKGKWGAIAVDKSRWLVDIIGRLRRCVVSSDKAADLKSWPTWCPGPGFQWEVMSLRGVETVEAQNKDRAVATNAYGEIFAWDGKDWKQVPFDGKATRASVSDNWVYWMNEKGEAFYGRDRQ